MSVLKAKVKRGAKVQRRANVSKCKQDKQRHVNFRTRKLFKRFPYNSILCICYKGKSGEGENCLQFFYLVAKRSGDYRERTKSDIYIIVTDKKVVLELFPFFTYLKTIFTKHLKALLQMNRVIDGS